MYKQRECYSNYQCKCRVSASVTISVRIETVLVQVHHNKTCTHYCNRNGETLMGELLGLVQINNLG